MIQSRPPVSDGPEGPGVRTITGQTVRDPVCGTYVAVELAIPGPDGGTPVYFCSEACKQSYRALKT